MLDLTFFNNTRKKAFERKFFHAVLQMAIKEVKLDKKLVGVSLNIVGNTKIKSLNGKYRKKHKATDVLSFPLIDPKRKPDAKINKSAIMELGDIFICPQMAEKNARKQNISLKNEMALLAVHGFLHLIGHDHENTEQEKKMTILQQKILRSL